MLAPHVDGITADAATCRRYLDRSHALITAFLPRIGYEQAQAWLAEYKATGGTDLRAFLVAKLGREVVEQTLLPENLMALGFRSESVKSVDKVSPC
jgi:aspartate ammonia-lyase